MNKKEMEAEELKWRAESDARTLAEYQQIVDDKPRLKRAMEAAQKQIDDLQTRANALGKSLTGLKKNNKPS